jgi:hypothetical protein
MRRRRTWVLLVLVAVAAGLVYLAWPGKSTFTIGPATTYVTGPLDQQGYPDYVTALNERLSQGITPQNNANVLIWQAVGPTPEGGTPMPAEYFRWLGIEPPPEKGAYLVSWKGYLQERAKSGSKRETDPVSERIAAATPWPWQAKEAPEVIDWLNRNEQPLGLIVQASRRPDYYNPLMPERIEDGSPGLLGALLPAVQPCREAANALTCRAMLRLSQGQVDEAWQDLLACHRLGRLVARGGTLIEFLVGVAIDQIASKADLALIDQARLNSPQVLARLQDLRRLPPLSRVADKIDWSERCSLLETMLLTARLGTSYLEDVSRSTTTSVPPRDRPGIGKLLTRGINWDPALRNANRWIDRCVTALRMPDRTAREQAMAAMVRDLKLLRQQTMAPTNMGKALLSSSMRGETIGNMVICLMLPAFEKVQTAAERSEQTQRNLHLAFALVAYQRDHGHYPAKLEELAPKYLAKIPDDLFSGKPLLYRLEGQGILFYSIGPNGVDEGGRGADDDTRGDDLSVRLPVPRPRVKE